MLATLPPEMTQYQWYWRLGRPHGWSGLVGKIYPARGFDPRSVQPIATNYCPGPHLRGWWLFKEINFYLLLYALASHEASCFL